MIQKNKIWLNRMLAALNNHSLLWAAIAIFMISVVVRSYLAIFDKSLLVYADELRYVGIARSIWNDGSIAIRGYLVDFQKILYSLALLPANIATNMTARMTIMSILNSVYMSSAVFPTYLIAKRTLQNRWAIFISMIFAMILPVMLYSMTLMSENIYFPLTLWNIVLGCKAFESNTVKGAVLWGAFAGFCNYLLYLSKEIALAWVLAYGFMVILNTVTRKKFDKIKLASLVSYLTAFIILFIAFKLTIFSGMGNSYDQMGLQALSTPYAWAYLVYSIVYTFVGFLIAFFFFPIVIPLLNLKKYTEKSHFLYGYSLAGLLTSILVIAYTICIREDLGIVAPRLHLRYVDALMIPFFILFIQLLFEHPKHALDEQVDKRQVVLIMTASILAILTVFKGVTTGSPVDQTSLFYIISTTSNKWITEGYQELNINLYLIIVKLIIILGIFVGIWILKKASQKRAVIFFMTAIFSLNIINGYIGYNLFKKVYSVPSEQIQEAQVLNDFLKSDRDANIFAVINYNTAKEGNVRILDTYIDGKVWYTSDQHLLQLLNGDESFDIGPEIFQEELTYSQNHSVQKTPDSIDYIITNTAVIGFNNAELLMSLPANRFKLYRNLSKNTISPFNNSLFPTEKGSSSTTDVSELRLSSWFEIKDGRLISDGAGFLAFGPYESIEPGVYTVTFEYEYWGDLPTGTPLGHVDWNFVDSNSPSPAFEFKAGDNKVTIENWKIESFIESTEVRMYANVSGVELKKATVTKIE